MGIKIFSKLDSIKNKKKIRFSILPQNQFTVEKGYDRDIFKNEKDILGFFSSKVNLNVPVSAVELTYPFDQCKNSAHCGIPGQETYKHHPSG